MKKHITILFLLFTTLFNLHSEEIHFVRIENLIKQEIGALIIPEIFKKMDIDVTITPLPAERAQHLVISGVKDGEIMRVYAYGIENPAMIRVPTPYYYIETTAFIKIGRDIIINSKDDLSNYRLAKVLGIKHTNNITEGLDNVVNITNTDNMMKLLDAERFDIALTSKSGGLSVINRLGLDNLTTIPQPLAKLDLFIYVHEKHKGLVPQIDDVIKNMKQSGELADLIKKAEYNMYSALDSTYSQ